MAASKPGNQKRTRLPLMAASRSCLPVARAAAYRVLGHTCRLRCANLLSMGLGLSGAS